MKGLSFLFACAVLTAFFAASIWRERLNTFESYPEWHSAKTDLALGVNGARSFTVTPISLLGRSLNLAAWHGHQEVILDKEWEKFPEVRLRVFTEGSAEWSLIARSPQGLDNFALRLSSSALHSSAWLWLNEERAFTRKEILSYQLPGARWVDVELLIEGEKLVAYADKVKIGSVELPAGAWRIALRAASTEGVARVDDLFFRSPSKSYHQNFSGNFPLWIIPTLGVALFCIFLLLKLVAGSGPACGVAIVIVFSLGLVTWFYDSKFANQYPMAVNLKGHSVNIEDRQAALNRLRELPSGKAVVLWLGGSQAWGAGASQPRKTVFGRLRDRLDFSSLEFVNGAISGATLEDQLEVLRIAAARRVVKAVVITTGVNDAKNHDFPAKLALVYAALKKRDAKLLLVPEPMEPPVTPSVKARHEEIAKFAREHAISWFDLPAAFEQNADAGFLWWDFVHMSDIGAAIAADVMAPVLRELIVGLQPVKEKGARKRNETAKQAR